MKESARHGQAVVGSLGGIQRHTSPLSLDPEEPKGLIDNKPKRLLLYPATHGAAGGKLPIGAR